jgi:hypothetical protein
MSKMETAKQILRETGPEITFTEFERRFGRRFSGGLANSVFYIARKSILEEREAEERARAEEQEAVEEPEPVAVAGSARHTQEEAQNVGGPAPESEPVPVNWAQVYRTMDQGRKFLSLFSGDKAAAKEFLDRVL